MNVSAPCHIREFIHLYDDAYICMSKRNLDFLFCMGVPVAVYQNLLVSLSLPSKFMKQLIFQLSTGCFTEIKPIFMVALKYSQFFTHKNQFQTPNAQFTVYAI